MISRISSFIVALAALVGQCAFSGPYTGLIATELAAESTKQTDVVATKVKRSECKVCNGTGKVKAGDTVTVVWRCCDNCEPDGVVKPSPTPKPQGCQCGCGKAKCNCGKSASEPGCAPVSSIPEDDTHAHICPQCKFKWWHNEATTTNNLRAHNCPRCGTYNNVIAEWKVPRDRAPVECQKPKPVEPALQLLVFSAPWCTNCRAMEGDQKPLSETKTPQAPITILKSEGVRVGGKFSDQIRIVNSDKYPDFVKHYQIDGLPTIIVRKDGMLVKKVVGNQSLDQLRQLLK